jgi:predicted PurR-regulated permease PerM
MSRLFSFAVLVGILVVIGIIFYHVMATFILPIFLATLLVAIFYPVHRWICQKVGNRQYLAGVLSTAVVISLVLVPSLAVTVFAVLEASRSLQRVNLVNLQGRLEGIRQAVGLDMPLAEQWRNIEGDLNKAFLANADGSKKSSEPVSEDIVLRFTDLTSRMQELEIRYDEEQAAAVRAALQDILSKEPATIEYDVAVQEALRRFTDFQQDIMGGTTRTTLKKLANPSEEQLRTIALSGMRSTQTRLLSMAGDTTAFIAKMLVGLIIMVVATFFFFVDGPKMVESITSLAPLDPDYQRELLVEFDRVSRAVVVATLLSAVAQGILGALGYYFAGLEAIFFLMLLTAVFAMIPFFGAAAVWVPCCLWLAFFEDRWLAAGMLAVYGTFGISLIDNIIKPWVLHGQSKLHPLIALLSVLGGVQALGPIGILVGPMVVVFLVTLLKILRRELTKLERLPWANGEAGSTSTSNDPASGRTEGAT